MRRNHLHTAALAISGGLLAAVLGCQSAGPVHAPPNFAPRTPVPHGGNAALVEYLADQPWVSHEAGYRAAYLLAEDTAFEGDFADLDNALRDRGIVPKRWGSSADAPLNRGEVSYLVARAIVLKRGTNWLLTGLERYACQELQYLGVVGPGGELGRPTGGEFVGILSRAEAYRRGEPWLLKVGEQR